MKISLQSNTQTIHSKVTKTQSIPDHIYTQLCADTFLSDFGEIPHYFPLSSRYFKECIVESITDIIDNDEVKTHYDIDTDDSRLEIITCSDNKKIFHMTFQLFSKLNSVKKKFLLYETKMLITVS